MERQLRGFQSPSFSLRNAQEMWLGIENTASCGALVLPHRFNPGYDVQKMNHSFQNVCGSGLAKVNSDATDAQGLAWNVRFHPGLPKQALAFFRGFPTLEDARGNLARVRVLLG
jgi:hypothetical protein